MNEYEFSIEDHYQFTFPNSMTPEEVLHALLADVRSPIASLEGSARILSDGKDDQLKAEAIKWIQRCTAIMRRVFESAKLYLEALQREESEDDSPESPPSSVPPQQGG